MQIMTLDVASYAGIRILLPCMIHRLAHVEMKSYLTCVLRRLGLLFAMGTDS